MESGVQGQLLLEFLGWHHQGRKSSRLFFSTGPVHTSTSFANSPVTLRRLQWSSNRSTSLLTLPTHSCTYSTAFSPHSASILTAVSSDSRLRVFDLRTPSSASNHLVQDILITAASATPAKLAPGPPAGPFPPSEALSHDWNKYRDTIIATAGVDRVIRTLDLRFAQQNGPSVLLQGHEYAVRKVAWSPHLGDTLLSASYDMTCRVWNDGSSGKVPAGEIGCMSKHTEFAIGVDWCLFGSEGWAASVGWDEKVYVWDIRNFMTAQLPGL